MAEPRAGPERVRARLGSPEKGGGGLGLQSSPASAPVWASAAVRCGRGGPALAEGAGRLVRAGAESPRCLRLSVPVRSQDNEYDEREARREFVGVKC